MQDERHIKVWQGEESIDLRHVWAVVDRSKWRILGLALGLGLVATIAVTLMTPSYTATSTVLIESEQANVVSIEEVYGLEMRDQQYFETQYALLRSRPVAEKVIQSLNLTEPKEPERLHFEGGWFTSKILALRVWLQNLGTQPDNGTKLSLQQAVKSYGSRLEIEPISNTQLVQIRFTSSDPKLAADAANAHAKAYIESILETRLAVTESARGWMNRRVEELRKQLNESEQALQEFSERQGLIDTEGIQTLPTRTINELSSDLVDARRKLSEAQIAYEQLPSSDVEGDTGGLEGTPAVMNDLAVRRFREIQAEAEQRVAELAQRYGPKHPKMITARSELNTASANLRRQQRAVVDGIAATYNAARSDVAQVERELAAAKANFQNVERSRSRLTELRREVETNRQLYDMFYGRIQEMAQTGDLESVNARITSPAVVPIDPSGPKKRLIVAMMLAAGLVVGIVLAFLGETLNNPIRSFEDVETKLNLPMLGMVPLVDDPSMFDADAPQFKNAFGAVRTGIMLDRPDTPHKVILVTSAVPNEGKSTVAMNLGYAFSTLERTLIIDGDLRQPSISGAVAAGRYKPGLAQLLEGKASVDDCIFHHSDKNVDIMATGLVSPDALELLSSPRLAQAFQVLRQKYDRIVIDSPPVLAVSDPILLGKLADTIVVVVKADETDARIVRHGLRKLEPARVPICGLVLNQLDFRKAGKYSDYGYGGYGEIYGANA